MNGQRPVEIRFGGTHTYSDCETLDDFTSVSANHMDTKHFIVRRSE